MDKDNTKTRIINACICLTNGREIQVQHPTTSIRTHTILGELLGYYGNGRRATHLTYQLKQGVSIGINTSQILCAMVNTPK